MDYLSKKNTHMHIHNNLSVLLGSSWALLKTPWPTCCLISHVSDEGSHIFLLQQGQGGERGEGSPEEFVGSVNERGCTRQTLGRPVLPAT